MSKKLFTTISVFTIFSAFAFCKPDKAEILRLENLEIASAMGDRKAELELLGDSALALLNDAKYFCIPGSAEKFKALCAIWEKKAAENDPDATLELAKAKYAQNLYAEAGKLALRAIELGNTEAYEFLDSNPSLVQSKKQRQEFKDKAELTDNAFFFIFKSMRTSYEDKEKIACLLSKAQSMPNFSSYYEWTVSRYDEIGMQESADKILRQQIKDGRLKCIPVLYKRVKDKNPEEASALLEQIRKLAPPMRTKLLIEANPDNESEIAVLEKLSAAGFIWETNETLASHYLAPDGEGYEPYMWLEAITNGETPRDLKKGIALLKSLADKGYGSPMRMLTRYYLMIEKDVPKAMPYLKKLAEFGQSEACSKLYIWNKFGLHGFEKDEAAAEKYWRLGCERDPRWFYDSLQSEYENEGLSKTPEEERRIDELMLFSNEEHNIEEFYIKYRASFTDGEKRAFIEKHGLQPLHDFKEGKKHALENKWPEAFEKFKSSGEAGHRFGMTALYYCYSEGKGTAKNKAAAREWLEMAATDFEREHSSDFYTAYVIFEGENGNSIGKESDQQTLNRLGKAFLELMLESGNNMAADNLKKLYMKSDSKEDRDKLFELLKKSLNSDYIYREALDMIIFMIENKDYFDSKIFEKAVEKNTQAGKRRKYAPYLEVIEPYLYLEGLGVDKNEAKAVEMLKDISADGNPLAGALLAYCIERGRGAEANPEEADKIRREIIRKTSPKDDYDNNPRAVADFFAGDRYRGFNLKRLFFPVDKAEAIKWLDLAADEGFPKYLADAYIFDSEVIEGYDVEKAIEVYKKVPADNTQSLFGLADIYLNYKSDPDYAKGFDCLYKSIKTDKTAALERISQSTDSTVYHNFACFLLEGKLLPKDEENAAAIFKVMSKTNPHAKEMLAYCLQKGIGIEKDASKAEELRQEIIRGYEGKKAKGGMQIFPYFALRYEEGANSINSSSFLFVNDEQMRRYWMEKALRHRPIPETSELLSKLAFEEKPAEKELILELLSGFLEKFPDNENAMLIDAVFRLNGTIDQKDKSKAVQTVKELAEKNYPHAVELLSFMHETGTFVEKDADKSKELFEKFLKLRKRTSIYFDMYERYESGAYIAKDSLRAAKFLTLGADRGEKRCFDELEKRQ